MVIASSSWPSAARAKRQALVSTPGLSRSGGGGARRTCVNGGGMGFDGAGGQPAKFEGGCEGFPNDRGWETAFYFKL
jgi:hypothetical protein